MFYIIFNRRFLRVVSIGFLDIKYRNEYGLYLCVNLKVLLVFKNIYIYIWLRRVLIVIFYRRVFNSFIEYIKGEGFVVEEGYG